MRFCARIYQRHRVHDDVVASARRRRREKSLRPAADSQPRSAGGHESSPLAYRHLFGLRALRGPAGRHPLPVHRPVHLAGGTVALRGGVRWSRAPCSSCRSRCSGWRDAASSGRFTIWSTTSGASRTSNGSSACSSPGWRIGLIVHGEVARREVIGALSLAAPGRQIAIVFHPNYIGAYPDHRHARAGQAAAGDRSRASVVILSLGQIRRYKGLLELVRAFRGDPGIGRAPRCGLPASPWMQPSQQSSSAKRAPHPPFICDSASCPPTRSSCC